MPGPFVMKGMEVHVTKFEIALDEDGKPAASLQLGLVVDVWPMWLDVAIEHALAAQESRDKLVALLAKGREGVDPQDIADLLTRECQASLVAVAASAFALENFHSGALQRMPGAEELREQISDKPARVREVLRRLMRPTRERTSELRALIKSIYLLRDKAVHASAELQELVNHDLLQQPVEWRFAQYTAQIANTVVYSAAGVLMEACHQEQASPELAEWCQVRRERIEERFGRAALLEPRH